MLKLLIQLLLEDIKGKMQQFKLHKLVLRQNKDHNLLAKQVTLTHQKST